MTLRILVLLGISTFAGAANAFQMGEVSAHSRIGEPLNATVGLWLSPQDKQQAVRFKIDPDHSYTSNPELTAIVKRMEAGLVQNPDGSAYVNLKTADSAPAHVCFTLCAHIKPWHGPMAVVL